MGQGTITCNSTRKTEPKKQKTEQPAKQNSGTKQTSNNQKQKSKPISQPTGYVNGHEWVDLGLSVKWATCNVGASSPSNSGRASCLVFNSSCRYTSDSYCKDGQIVRPVTE